MHLHNTDASVLRERVFVYMYMTVTKNTRGSYCNQGDRMTIHRSIKILFLIHDGLARYLTLAINMCLKQHADSRKSISLVHALARNENLYQIFIFE